VNLIKSTKQDFVVEAGDGLRLAARCSGDPEGRPVVMMHGMPGSRLGPLPRGKVLERMGIRLISYDRPGYGRSERRARRKVADAAPDVNRIADHLELDRFAVVWPTPSRPARSGTIAPSSSRPSAGRPAPARQTAWLLCAARPPTRRTTLERSSKSAATQ
jgi:hypothetical protein